MTQKIQLLDHEGKPTELSCKDTIRLIRKAYEVKVIALRLVGDKQHFLSSVDSTSVNNNGKSAIPVLAVFPIPKRKKWTTISKKAAALFGDDLHLLISPRGADQGDRSQCFRVFRP